MGKSKILSEQEFKEKTRDLNGMEYIEYIKKYCDKKLSNFKLDPVYFEQTAYHDVTYYIDEERKLLIEDRFYIGE